MKIKLHPKLSQGFSLVELLVVIAVIAIIASIAIPNIGDITTGARTATAQRTAQNLASLASSAAALGITNASVAAWVTALSNGVSTNIGGQTVGFRADGLTSDTNYLTYLAYTNGNLIYNP